MRTPLWLLVLAGCPSVGPGEWDSVRDRDGDGQDAVRFGGFDCADTDPNIQICDGDSDGHTALSAGGDDCDDADNSVVRRTFYDDLDDDGYGDPARAVDTCERGNLAATGDDCDDGDPNVHPSATEQCDELDRDCDGRPYTDTTGGQLWFVDGDGDGFGRGLGDTQRCAPGEDEAELDGDCDDADDTRHPGATDLPYDGVDADCAGDSDYDADRDGTDAVDYGGTDCRDDDPLVSPDAVERCNHQDDDCDGRVDDDDDDGDQVDQVEVFDDGDGDGFGAALARYCFDAVPDGFVTSGGDCDDTRVTVNPAASEVCNGLDDDCDAQTDENAINGVVGYDDGDGDGWGTSTVAGTYCGALPVNVAARDGDCDDGDDTFFPGAEEDCYDGRRQDCDPGPADDCDLDGDPDATDCDDDDPAVSSGSPEVCDGEDNDCDGLTDGADPSVDADSERFWFQDIDRDGFGGFALPRSCTPPAGSVDNGLDCDDIDADRAPGAPERCNGVDDDCDAVVDEDPADPPAAWFDADGDTFGDPASPLVGTCTNPDPALWVAVAGDCRPLDRDVSPGAQEVCDGGVDNDCDGLADDADSVVAGAVWFLDADDDGYGLSADRVVACAAVPGRSLAPGDCDDSADAIHPGVAEICNFGVDDDCDGEADDADSVNDAPTWFEDLDGDGYGTATNAVETCVQPPQTSAVLGDCDDSRPAVNPASIELCDAQDRDEDCDGIADDDDPSAQGRLLVYDDLDGDSFPGTGRLSCSPGAAVATDCDDGDAAVRPNAAEVCDGQDNNCDGVADPAIEMYPDVDGDGFPAATGAQMVSCSFHPGFIPDDGQGTDCADDEPTARPDYPFEICTDGIDNDCDLVVDVEDPNAIGCGGPVAGAGVHAFWLDGDGDGWGNGQAAPTYGATAAAGRVANALDCDDTSAASAAPELITDVATLEARIALVRTVTTCAAYQLDVTRLDFVDLDVGNNTATTRLLVGVLDGVGARTTLGAPRITVDDAQTTLVLAGVDLSPNPIAQDDWPIDLTAGTLTLGDVLAADGGVRQTGGGNLKLYAVTVASSPATVDGPSAVWVTGAASFVAQHLSVFDAAGDDSVRVDIGVLTDVSAVRSAPVSIAGARAAASVASIDGGSFHDCDTTCLRLVPGNLLTSSAGGLEIARAGGDGVLVSPSGTGTATLDHLTVVGSGQTGLVAYGGTVSDSVVWGSGSFDLAGNTVVVTDVVYSTESPGFAGAPLGGVVPGFQAWHPNLPVSAWDLHLADVLNSAFRYMGGDLGAYPASDTYYDDVDVDGLFDGWELRHFGDLAQSGGADPDADGATDAVEFAQGTSPVAEDTDGDGSDDAADPAPLDGATP